MFVFDNYITGTTVYQCLECGAIFEYDSLGKAPVSDTEHEVFCRTCNSRKFNIIDAEDN